MQVKIIAVRMLLVLQFASVLTACSSSPARQGGDWVDMNMGAMVIRERDRLPDQDVFELEAEVEGEAASLLLDSGLNIAAIDLLPIKDVPRNARARLEESGGGLYLVRAVSGEVEGAFSAFSNGQMIQVLYGNFGDCGEIRRRVILVRLDAAPSSAFAGCSGAL